MFTVRDSIRVDAPVDRCFLLSTSIDLVGPVLGFKAVEGKRSGLVVMGDQLVWRGWKFGLPQMHETLITAYDRPGHFQDTMGRGRFAAFQHDHWFREVDGGTLLEDEVRFSMPLGPLGRVVGRVVMVPHVRGLVRRRFAMLKAIAEGGDWVRWVDSRVDSRVDSPVD